MKNLIKRIKREFYCQMKLSNIFIFMMVFALVLSFVISNNRIMILEKMIENNMSFSILSIFENDGKSYIDNEDDRSEENMLFDIVKRIDISNAIKISSIFVFIIGLLSIFRYKQDNLMNYKLKDYYSILIILFSLIIISFLIVFIMFFIPIVKILINANLNLSEIEMEAILIVFFSCFLLLSVLVIISLLLSLISGKKMIALFSNVVLWITILQIVPVYVKRILWFIVTLSVLLNGIIVYDDYLKQKKNENLEKCA